MLDWTSYGLSDFLLFSERTYWRLFERQIAELWPWPLLTSMALAAAFAAVLARWPRAEQVLFLLLALGWGWVAADFLAGRYAPINWAALYAVPVFAVQAVLLAAVALRADATPPSIWQRRLGAAIGTYALLVHPFIGSEVAGFAPDPTAFATLGAVMIAGRSAALMAVPVLWCGLSALVLHALGSPMAWGALTITAIALGSRVLARFSP